MKSEGIIERADEHLFRVYNRFPVVFSHGKGMYLYDVDGKAYLDFAAGIGVLAFGHSDKEFLDALKEQVDKLLHVSNLFYFDGIEEAAGLACDASGMDRVFFTNSGAEAVEGALKTAKKFGYNRDGHDDFEIVAMENAFHGRTIGALSVTGTSHYREPFYPLMDGVRFAAFNDIGSVEEQISEKTIAIIAEPIQGEGGVVPAEKEFLLALRRLCDERGLLLIFDEIQCGMGRTGNMFAWQGYGVKPDIICMAKALGGGIPVGAFAMTEKVAGASMVPGDHGSTYGGNPLALAAVRTSICLMRERQLPERVDTLSLYFEHVLDDIKKSFDFIIDRRGAGFMQGLVLDASVPVGNVVGLALEKGLILLSAGGNVLRFLPPLVAEKEDIDNMGQILREVLALL